jgi:hypothetical protein
VTARVTAIDLASRFVTLSDADGDSITVFATDEVKRLNEVKVGDTVRADYKVTLLGELREPTEEEKQHPLVAIDLAGRAPQHHAPAGGTARGFKAVTTVRAIDLNQRTVTLMGPLGDQVMIGDAKPENLARLKVGDTVVVTYTEAMVISLEKTSPSR